MSCKVARLSAIGMMAVLTPLAFAGCLAQESDESANDESASTEQLGSIRPHLSCTSPNIAQNPPGSFTCQSGWPGSRQCIVSFISATDVVSIELDPVGPVGDFPNLRTTSGIGTQHVEASVTVHEGDAFSPGKNTTSYNVFWCRKPF
jgi:hypothetical protein